MWKNHIVADKLKQLDWNSTEFSTSSAAWNSQIIYSFEVFINGALFFKIKPQFYILTWVSPSFSMETLAVKYVRLNLPPTTARQFVISNMLVIRFHYAFNTGSWSQPLRDGPDNLPPKRRMRPTRQAPLQRLGPQVRPGRWFANRFF